MDLTSLYYFSELAKDLNMTKTAARLYISQQTLSNHIHRLEQYYNAPLFYRKPSLSLTCAGEFVLSFAQIVEKEHVNLKDILSDIEGQERGMLRVGASLARGVQFLPRILPDFCRRYPKVEVRFTDGLSSRLEEMIEHGELDFAIVLSKSRSPNLVEHDLLQDQVYLCVPESLLQTHYTPEEAAAIKAPGRAPSSRTSPVSPSPCSLTGWAHSCTTAFPGQNSSLSFSLPAPIPTRPFPCVQKGSPPVTAPT